MIKPSKLAYNPAFVASAPETNHVILMNTLSTFFPEGEQFFVNAVRAYREKLYASGKLERGSTLDRDISTFIGHEAFHTIAHRALNDELYARGYHNPKWLSVLKRVPLWPALQATVVLEHYTGHLARWYFSIRHKLPPEVWELWDYHAREEIDHEHVAASVALLGPGASRSMFVPVSAVFLAVLAYYYVKNGGRMDTDLLSDLIGLIPVLAAYKPEDMAYA